MKSIYDLGFNFFIPQESFKKYQDIYSSNGTILEKVYNLLILNPKFMVSTKTDEEEMIKRSRNDTISELQRKINKNEKITFITFYFNTKPSQYDISGNLIAPDASDFLALLHLNTMIHFVNKVYSPGSVLRIGSEINYFHDFAQVEIEETQKMQRTLFEFNMISEKLINSQGQILLFDVEEEVQRYKKEFLSKIQMEKYNYIKKKEAMDEISEVANYYFHNVINTKHFSNEKEAWNFAIHHALDSTGYKNTLVSMFDTSEGLFKEFSNCLYVQSRFVDGSHLFNQLKKPEIYCSILPGAQTFSFNKLTLKRSDGLWDQIDYKDALTNDYEPFFVKDLHYPFFFKEVEESAKNN